MKCHVHLRGANEWKQIKTTIHTRIENAMVVECDGLRELNLFVISGKKSIN